MWSDVLRYIAVPLSLGVANGLMSPYLLARYTRNDPPPSKTPLVIAGFLVLLAVMMVGVVQLIPALDWTPRKIRVLSPGVVSISHALVIAALSHVTSVALMLIPVIRSRPRVCSARFIRRNDYLLASRINFIVLLAVMLLKALSTGSLYDDVGRGLLLAAGILQLGLLLASEWHYEYRSHIGRCLGRAVHQEDFRLRAKIEHSLLVGLGFVLLVLVIWY